MNITARSWRTLLGCLIILIAAGLYLFYPREGLALFMVGVAVSFYGLYRRVKKHIKKPMLRG